MAALDGPAGPFSSRTEGGDPGSTWWPRRVSVAPMLDWTDRFYRFFARQISRRAWLYTEMVTTGALIHGDAARFLRFDACEHPLALQLGGSEPADLARCAKLAAEWGYDEINLNVGCPSERVQSGAFGACLMAEPVLVADCLKAMQDVVDVPVTVKHRIGIDRVEDYAFLADFVDQVHRRSGCTVFIVHARNAILKGLSPKENREIPPLRYDYVHRLKQAFPDLDIHINGGFRGWADIQAQWDHVDGVMVGREAYHNPWMLADADRLGWGDARPAPTRRQVAEAMAAFCAAEVAQGVPLKAMTRHILGLYQGLPGARQWRRMLSDAMALRENDAGLILAASDAVERRLSR
ncbi:tRNA dihydrouridine(20/20a) synthase DusA [Nitrogeniibacter mangrovi]|uniref:tRNA-dihydrouridine(20/20a) synthase n=1 Tax=Nitrogeniibacter mangrovi TaxID=2016596 RepID=A0A6C1B7Q8_9RHOO|nr:tRNA dihydrouridine(20/20a) synthase DusA [Nitrogeniibacter mangrovi]QID19403.1 tRNA dihydrouridine(20/20a) synthase DusA [Nitrogeniibacter mangrovi]